MINRKENVVCIIQARRSSKRFPDKIFKKILNKITILDMILLRVKQSKLLNQIIVATSLLPEDNKIESTCNILNVNVFRGSLDNVLDRFYQAALKYNKPDIIVRLTGDNPLIDPNIIDMAITHLINNKLDYLVTNTTFPEGIGTEVMTFDVLKYMWEKASSNFDKEHVTPYIKHSPNKFKTDTLSLEKDYSCYRLTIDYPQDLELIKKICKQLGKDDLLFSWQECIAFLNKNPELVKINSEVLRSNNYR